MAADFHSAGLLSGDTRKVCVLRTSQIWWRYLIVGMGYTTGEVTETQDQLGLLNSRGECEYVLLD
jgi:hypothetical protein